jgi:hypothetical protein
MSRQFCVCVCVWKHCFLLLVSLFWVYFSEIGHFNNSNLSYRMGTASGKRNAWTTIRSDIDLWFIWTTTKLHNSKRSRHKQFLSKALFIFFIGFSSYKAIDEERKYVSEKIKMSLLKLKLLIFSKSSSSQLFSHCEFDLNVSEILSYCARKLFDCFC